MTWCVRGAASLATAVIAVPALAGSLSVPNSFSNGTRADAGEVNANFTAVEGAVNDNHARIAAIEGASLDFTGYSLPFSAIGAARNVLVLRARIIDELTGQLNGFSYKLRTRFQSNTDTVPINGVPTARTYFAEYVSFTTDPAGNLTSDIFDALEGLDSEAYLAYNGVDRRLERTTLVPLSSNEYRNEETCATSIQVQICTRKAFETSTGRLLSESVLSSNSAYALLGALTVNGIAFADVRAEQRLSTSRVRYRARGVGLIYELDEFGLGAAMDELSAFEIIYYRVGGVEAGTLAGTPLVNAPLAGAFF